MFDFLTQEEVTELTGKQRSNAQGAALKAMRIPAVCRPDGRWLVLRATISARFKQPLPERKEIEPDWAALL